MEELKRDVCHAVMAQVHRLDVSIGREDSSAHESYGLTKQALERLKEGVKPMDKLLADYWQEVVRADPVAQAGMLHEMRTMAERIAVDAVCLSAVVCRGESRISGTGRQRLGQMSLDDVEESEFQMDEETGEIVEDGD